MPTEPVVVVGRTCVGDFCHVPVTVEGVPCTALVDTGSTVTLVRPDVVPGWTQLEPTTVQLRTVTGGLAPMKGRGEMTLTVGGKAVRHPVWVASVQDPCILGLDFLKATGCQLDLGRGTLRFQDGPVIALSAVTPPVAAPTTLPAREVGTVEPRATPPFPQNPSRHQGACFPNRPPLHAHSIAVQSPPSQLETEVTAPNSSPPLLAVPAPNSMGCSSPALLPQTEEEVSLLPQTEEEATRSAITKIWMENCDDLDSQQQELLWRLLVEFKDSFALREDDVGRTQLVEHEIDTGDARPIKCRPRRLPLARQEACDKAVGNMLQAGVIEPSDSPWAAAVVMVPKKNGEWRLCSDYRPLNGVTKKDSYPLPRVDESLDLVSGSAWFSSLDLRSGYYQMPLAPSARPKTAFCTGRGLWQFKVLSFGLCNAPASFARLMDQVLTGIPRQECLVYLDDILAHGPSFDAALLSLRRVLERIRAAGLKLHPDKCHFMQRQVTFLGHRVGREGISTVQDKVQAVADWPVPSTQKDLKSFLGLASYYRRFVRGFSCIAAPLFQLLHKDREFVWTDACQGAFDQLRRALSDAPVLAPADPSLPFMLDTDASGVGAGGVLSQVGADGERVVAYFSRVFNKAEKRYCVTRRELLAVVLSVRHFKYYLCGLPFTVRTDHSALQWLMSFREPEGQVARWLEELQAYNFTVVHRAGAQHSNADALSRRPCAADGCHHCERRESRELELCEEEQQQQQLKAVRRAEVVDCRELQMVSVGEWRQQQELDPDLHPVHQWVESQQRPPWEEVARLSQATKGLWSKFNSLRLIDGVLQRAWKEPATGEERWQLVVPKGLRTAVLQGMHGASGSGHFGVTKTLRRLRQGFYWGHFRRDVEDFCRRCDLCTARKGPTGRSHAQLQQHLVGAPMERVAVDVMGPLPRTNKGNVYILSVIDYFTKWPEAYALPNQEAETVADALLGGILSRFGLPDTLHSDQGRNFESRVFAAMCSRLGIQKTRTTPLRPQSDGLVERLHRTLGQQLAILTSEHQRDWDEHLPLVLMACRSAVQESTTCSPALLMLGRELRTPAELAFGRPPDAPVVPPGPEYARRLQDRLESAHAFARVHQESAGARQKRNYDVRARGRHFQAGELVWVYNPQRKKGRCPKLDSQWVGPCRVLERMGEVVYRVQLPPRGRKVALHRDRLAPYQGNALPQVPGTPRTQPQPPALHTQTPHPPQPVPDGGDPDSVPVAPWSQPTSPAPGLSLLPPFSLHTHTPHPPQPVPDGGDPDSVPVALGSQPTPPAPGLSLLPPVSRPQRARRQPQRYADFVCSLVDEELCSGGVM